MPWYSPEDLRGFGATEETHEKDVLKKSVSSSSVSGCDRYKMWADTYRSQGKEGLAQQYYAQYASCVGDSSETKVTSKTATSTSVSSTGCEKYKQWADNYRAQGQEALAQKYYTEYADCRSGSVKTQTAPVIQATEPTYQQTAYEPTPVYTATPRAPRTSALAPLSLPTGFIQMPKVGGEIPWGWVALGVGAVALLGGVAWMAKR